MRFGGEVPLTRAISFKRYILKAIQQMSLADGIGHYGLCKTSTQNQAAAAP